MNRWAWLVVTVALYYLAHPPVDLGWLGFVALAPWCPMVRRCRSVRQAAVVGYLAGFLILATGCFWLRKSHPLNLILMLLPAGLYFAGFAGLLHLLHVRRNWPAMLCLPVLMVVQEFARRHVPLDGFPWLLLGYASASVPYLLQFADVAGVYGLTFLFALSAGTLDDVLVRWRERELVRRALPVLGLLLVVLLALTYGWSRLRAGAAVTPGPRLLLVQGNIPQALKNAGQGVQEWLGNHLRLTREGLEREPSVDAVIWPETILPYVSLGGPDGDVYYEQGTRIVTAGDFREFERGFVQDRMQPVLAAHGAWWLTGAITFQGDRRAGTFETFNSALAYDTSGQRRATYHKSILVPGGEYVPFLGLLPAGWQQSLRDVVERFAGFLPALTPGPGPELVALPSAGGAVPLGLTICYEIAYPDYGRRVTAAGAEILVNLSNEAWFPESFEFPQYTAMARCRAVEVRRSLVRAANSGTSAFIDPWGRVEALTAADGRLHGFEGTLIGQPLRHQGRTYYVRFGDWLPWTCVAAAALLVLLRREPRDSR